MYNTTTLINAIKRNTCSPTSNQKFSDSDYIAIMNEQLMWLINTEFTAMNEDYFKDSVELPLAASQSDYAIPKTAAGWALEDIYYKDSYGNLSKLARRTLGRENTGEDTASYPSMIYLEDAFIRTYPSMSTSVTGSLVLFFNRILNQLKEVGSCGKITGVATLGTDYVLTCDATPVGVSTYGCDVINGNNPYNLRAADTSCTVAGLDVTVAQSVFDTTPVVGDWIAQTGFTPVPHIPSEWHPILVQAAVVKVLAADGDSKNYPIAAQELNAMLETLRRVTKDRIKGSPKKIISRSYVLNRQLYKYRW